MNLKELVTRKFGKISIEHPQPYVVQVVLNNPDKGNRLDLEMATDLQELFDACSLIRTGELRCLILTGCGNVFSGGADLERRKDQADAAWISDHAPLEAVEDAMVNCPIPIVTSINGPAIGAGSELVLASDLAYAFEGAAFGFTEAAMGFIAGLGGQVNLARIVGPRRAFEMLLQSEPFDKTTYYPARTMLEWGMLNGVLPSRAALASEVSTIAMRIAHRGPVAVRCLKAAVRAAMDSEWKAATLRERELYKSTVATRDRHIGITWALTRKDQRPAAPVFSGC